MAKSQRSKSTLSQSQLSGQQWRKQMTWRVTSADDVSVTSADDVSVMTSPRADVSKRNLARDTAWRRVGVRDSAWGRVKDPGGVWALVQNLLATREGVWQLWWWSGFHEKVDRRRRILVVPAKTQSEQGSRRWRSGSGFETMNDGGCRSGTRDDNWNAPEV